MSSETELPPPADDAFADVTALIRLIIDPKACQARLDAFTAASTKIRDEHTASERAYKARAAALYEREAAIAKLESDASANAREWAARKDAINEKEQRLHEISRNIRIAEDGFKRQILQYAGIASHFNEQLQDLPNWEQLARDVLGARNDAHLDGK